MIRVLHCVNNMHRAGLETMLMNYYRNIDRTEIQFDFLTHRPEKADYDDEIEAMGGRVYHAPRLYPWSYPAYFSYMRKFFREHPEYKIVHSHIDAMSYLPLLTAKWAGIPVRIAHSHSTSVDKDFKYILKQLFRSLLPGVANVRFACGEEAGRFLFKGAPFTVVPNAIDTDRFVFDADVRREKREAMGIQEDVLVVGHVGRFFAPKNHEFLVRVFAELSKKNENSILMLVGTGEKETEIKELICGLRLEEKVLFLGNREDVADLYQVMDVFLLPSLYEGVPLVGIEAQASSLPCIFSDRVPREVEITDCCKFLALENPLNDWIACIMDAARKGRTERKNVVRGSRYNIKLSCNKLEEWYVDLANKVENGGNR